MTVIDWAVRISRAYLLEVTVIMRRSTGGAALSRTEAWAGTGRAAAREGSEREPVNESPPEDASTPVVPQTMQQTRQSAVTHACIPPGNPD